MEKIRGKHYTRTCPGLLRKVQVRLFSLFICVLFPLSVFPVEAELKLSSSDFFEGEPFTLAFIFYGLNPDEVTGEFEAAGGLSSGAEDNPSAGIFPESFKIEAFRKTLSFLSPPGASSARSIPSTVVTFDIVARDSGNFTAGPFRFSAAGEAFVFDPVAVYVGKIESGFLSDDSFYTGTSIFWLLEEEGSFVSPEDFAGAVSGRSVRIVFAVPRELEGEVFSPAPENAILEAAPLPDETGGLSGPNISFAAAFYWTPLYPGKQELPQAVFSFTAESGAEVSLSSSPAYVDVLPDTDGTAESGSSSFVRPGGEKKQENPSSAVNPEIPAALVLGEDSPGFELAVAEKCRGLWAEGSYASAAVLLRTAESLYPMYSGISGMRKAVDEALSVKGKSSGNIELAVFFLPFFLIPASVVVLAASLLVFLKNRKNGTAKILLFTGAAVLVLGLGFSVYTRLSGGIMEAASTGGVISLIPEINSTPVAPAPAGTPLKILGKAGGWYHVRTNSGESGWYPFEDTVVYTSGDLNEFR